jgi:CubicO group peptidase (beta-lactamase class C family)
MQRAGLLSRDEPLGAFLPEVEGTPSADVSLDLLCAHRAGLHAHVEFFVKRAGAEQPTRATILPRAAQSRRPECSGSAPAEGFAPVYSDLGYILVGEALAARGGKALDELVAEHVGRPLGLTMGSVRYLERNEPLARARMVPTENVSWRGGVLHGVVHDENAWVLAGSGSAGHAGLFGDVWSVVRLATAVADGWAGRKDGWLSQRDLEPLLRRRAGGSHTAGFDTRSSADGAPMSGSHFGPTTFGHLGFTGTSMWIDPERALCAVLLTNRVHPSRDGEAIRAARPAAYDAMFEAMMGS